MGYIIAAEVDTTAGIAAGADRTKVQARVLSEHNGYITFYVKGDFDPQIQRDLVLELCRDLVGAGFVQFNITHRY